LQEYERLIGKARDRMLEAEGNSEMLTAGEKLELGQLYALCALAEKVEEVANAMMASQKLPYSVGASEGYPGVGTAG
jgi:nicotinate-nucleotide pyrophosphorylase